MAKRICGVIALKYNHEGACLSRVYLDEDVRGKGVGRWMITTRPGSGRVRRR